MSNFIETNAEEIVLRSMANVFISESLDPVGQEDDDINNDGKKNKTDKYLFNRRKTVGAAIAAEKAKRVKKEEIENSLWETLEEKKLYRPEKATTSDEKDIEIAEKSVKNKVKINPDINEEYLDEKNVPTNPSLWSKMKSRAKSKFDVYPSAYANGWAAKEYKKAGGGWKSVSEERGPCWKGYKQVGMKKKNGREVPNCVPVKEESLQEKSVSKAQQRFMGMVHAKKKGEMKGGSDEVQKAADSMSDKEAKKFASTKHKGLPEKKDVKESIKIISFESRDAVAAVRADIEKKYGKGAIMDTSPEAMKKRREEAEKNRKNRKPVDTRDEKEKETEGRYRSDGPGGAKRYQGD